MKFSYNFLQDLVKGKLPPAKRLAELLTLHTFEVREVKKMGRDFLLDVDVLPNRAGDCFSHLGIAQEIAALTKARLQLPKTKIKEDKKSRASALVAIKVKDTEDCPRYTARVMTEVKVAPSPQWLKERLRVCGLQAINNVVDIANYVMLEMGQPLHAFDFDKIENPKSQIPDLKPQAKSQNHQKIIIVRRAKRGEKITTLDNNRYLLDRDILLITDKDGPLAIAGIKGGKGSEIERKTTRIVLEAANFKPTLIRQGSRKLELKTDASWRFEHGLDPNMTEQALERAASLIQEVAGGKIWQGRVDVYPKRRRPKKIRLAIGYVSDLLGLKVTESEMVATLKALGFKVASQGREGRRQLMVQVPTRRGDISQPADLVEEIGRIIGFQKIPVSFPLGALAPPSREPDVSWRRLAKEGLKEAGFSEVYNYSFISEREANLFGYPASIDKGFLVELQNPLSSEGQFLRPSLTPALLKNVQHNFRFFREVRLFELGKVYGKIKNQKGPYGESPTAKIKVKHQNTKSNKDIKEKRRLAGVIGAREGKNDELFYEVKGAVEALLNKFGLSDVWYDDYQAEPGAIDSLLWLPSQSAKVRVGREGLGFLGAVSPSVLKKLGLGGKVFLFDLDFEKLSALALEEQEYQPLSPYPEAVRDLALLVPRGTRVAEVLNVINRAGGKLVRDVDLFDLYEGEELPKGKKNLAFHIIYQASDRTLNSREIEGVHQQIVKALEEQGGWEVRR